VAQGLIVFWMAVSLALAARKRVFFEGDTDVLSVAGVIAVGAAQLFPGHVWLSTSVFLGLSCAGVAALLARKRQAVADEPTAPEAGTTEPSGA
jgi:hypothetical protein